MNGGPFTPGVEQTRPGVYFNFTMRANERITRSERGRVALPMPMSWGAAHEMIEISSDTDAINKLGTDMLDPSLLLLREAKKLSQTVLVYRVNNGVQATASLGANQSATAVYGGVNGNDIQIVITQNALDAKLYNVDTFFSSRRVDRQSVAVFEELENNDYVVFKGTGTLTATAATRLTGGTDLVATNQDYMDFMAACENEWLDVVAMPVGEEALKVAFVSFIRRMREQGNKITGVLSNHAANYEAITNVVNGVVLDDGRTLTATEVVAWVAGASAGSPLTQSLTFTEYAGAVDVMPRLDHEETEAGLRRGEFIFTLNTRDRTVSVEQDINSLLGQTRLSKNRVVRTLDAIERDVTQSIREMIRGRKLSGVDIPANDDGAAIIKVAVVTYLNTLQDNNIIKNFEIDTDIDVQVTEAGDGIFVKLAIQPVDSAEKFYFDVDVN